MKQSLWLTLFFVLLFACAAAQKPAAPTRIYFDKAGPVHTKKPLIMVDGKETDFQSLVLDPSLIKRIDVLKNESAVAKYGDKARDGAVLITSKPGTEFYVLADFVNAEKNASVKQIELNGKPLPDANKILVEKNALVSTAVSTETRLDENSCQPVPHNALVIITKHPAVTQ